MPDVVTSDIALFADDAKLYRTINNPSDNQMLQEDLTALENWASLWQLRFHRQKCTVLTVGKSAENPRYTMQDVNGEVVLENVSQEKDLGITVDQLQ
jgi:hypothetical protein